MPTIKCFEEIDVWKKARVTQKIHSQATTATFANDFALKDQINASSGSIMDNIAEGYGRGGNKEFITFLSYARGSADESRSQRYRAFDRNHLTEEAFIELKADALEISKMITGFISYLQDSDIRGSKFREPFEQYGSSQTDA